MGESQEQTLDYRIGRGWGEADGGHPSGIVTHASHRDHEGWLMHTDDWRRGYQDGWNTVTGHGE